MQGGLPRDWAEALLLPQVPDMLHGGLTGCAAHCPSRTTSASEMS